MKKNTLNQFDAARAEYRAKDFENAFIHSAELSLDLTLKKGEKAIDEIIECMELAIASHSRLTGSPVPKLEGNDLFEHFFAIIRHYQDTREITNPEEAKKELTRNIPLDEANEKTPLFLEEEVHLVGGKLGPFSYALVSSTGPRDEMEDESLVTVFSLDRNHKVYCFAVLDGHGGAACAKFVKETLPRVVKEELKKKGWKQDIDIYNALRRSFVRIDREWKELPFQEQYKDYSGTTATVALVFGDRIFVANVGDSRAVLAKGTHAIQLSEDAKQTKEHYIREIILRGGVVKYGRVLGNRSTLDMARSIGDIDQASISALPTIKKFDLSTLGKEKSFLILACDGLWDVVSPKMVAEVCGELKHEKEIAKTLLSIAYQRGSADNVTIVVIHLPKDKTLLRQQLSV